MKYGRLGGTGLKGSADRPGLHEFRGRHYRVIHGDHTTAAGLVTLVASHASTPK